MACKHFEMNDAVPVCILAVFANDKLLVQDEKTTLRKRVREKPLLQNATLAVASSVTLEARLYRSNSAAFEQNTGDVQNNLPAPLAKRADMDTERKNDNDGIRSSRVTVEWQSTLRLTTIDPARTFHTRLDEQWTWSLPSAAKSDALIIFDAEISAEKSCSQM